MQAKITYNKRLRNIVKGHTTDKAAVTGGPYAQAIIHNDIIYVSGQGAVNPATNKIEITASAYL